MISKPKFLSEMNEILARNAPAQAAREDIVFTLLTPQEAELVGGGDNTGYCQGIGNGGYAQSGGGTFTQNGGQYTQSGGTYNMTCPQPSGPR